MRSLDRRCLLTTLISSLLAVGCQEAPLGNRDPVIAALRAVPDSIGPSDSTSVTCSATDPDGDTLVFDWVTDARLIIKGNPPNQYWLYDTRIGSQIFYAGPSALYPVDTAWVQCFARDRKGGSTEQLIRIKVHH